MNILAFNEYITIKNVKPINESYGSTETKFKNLSVLYETGIITIIKSLFFNEFAIIFEKNKLHKFNYRNRSFNCSTKE